MQKLIATMIAALLLSGLVVAFIMYKQLGTDTVTLAASPDLEPTADGDCGSVDLSIGARTLGQWYFEVPKAKTITGTVVVNGGESSDVGFSIWSPTNRVVVFNSTRTHETDFTVEQTIHGQYRFEFDNRHSTFTSKDVTVDLCVA